MIFWPTHTLILLMAESVRMVAMGDLMFFKSQTLTVRSSLPETTLSPTVNTAEVTVLQVKSTGSAHPLVSGVETTVSTAQCVETRARSVLATPQSN